MAVEPRHCRLMAIAEAAACANVHPSTLRRRIADGQLPAYRVVPKLLKVDLDNVEALIRPVPVTRRCYLRNHSPRSLHNEWIK